MAHPGRGLLNKREKFLFEPESDGNQADQDRHLDQRSNYRGKSNTRIDTKNCNGHGDGQLKIVGSSGEGKGD